LESKRIRNAYKKFACKAISVLLTVIFVSCTTIKTSEPTISAREIPLIVQPKSTLHLPITIDLKPYFNDIEKSIPKKMEGEESFCEGVSYSYKLNRSPIKFSGKSNELSYDIPCEYVLKLNYCPTCQGWFGKDSSCIIPRIYASCGVGEPLRKMEVGYTSKIGISKHWKFTSSTALRKVNAIDPCKVTFVNYNATDALVEEVTITLKELEKDIDKALQAIDLKPQIQEVWNSLNEPFNLQGYGFLHLNPQKIALDQVTFDKQIAKVNLNLELFPKLNFQSVANPTTSLPTLSNYKEKEEYELIIDVEAQYDSLNSLLRTQLVGKEMSVQGKKVIFDDVKIHSARDQRINLAVTISGSKKGVLYLEGTPVFHSLTQEISIPDLQFDLKTRNVLLKSAKWLFNSKIEEKIREASHFSLKPQLAELKKSIEKELNTEMQPGIFLSGKVNDIEIQDIYPFSEQLYIRVKMIGTMAVKM